MAVTRSRRMAARLLPTAFLLSAQPAFSQPVDGVFQGDADQRQILKTEPRFELYNWLYGSSRRSWYEWFTATAAVNSSLDQSGFRLRAMGAVGGYAIDIRGSDAESLSAAGYETNDMLSSMGTVGKFYGMNGFGGLQFGYSQLFDRGKVSAFVGMALVKDWANGSNMMAPFIRYALDAATLDVNRLGVLGSIEAEFRPTDDTMISGWAIYTPAYNWGYFEAKAGIAVPFRSLLPEPFRSAYVGPHLAISMTEGARQPMLGVHLSGVEIGGIHFNYAAGYTRESAVNGVYSILETTLPF